MFCACAVGDNAAMLLPRHPALLYSYPVVGHYCKLSLLLLTYVALGIAFCCIALVLLCYTVTVHAYSATAQVTRCYIALLSVSRERACHTTKCLLHTHI